MQTSFVLINIVNGYFCKLYCKPFIHPSYLSGITNKSVLFYYYTMPSVHPSIRLSVRSFLRSYSLRVFTTLLKRE